MSDRLHLPSRYLRQVEEILRENMPDAEVWAYGSRVDGTCHGASDLDIVVRGPGLRPIPSVDMQALREAFRESNIPIIVDAHDWSKLPETRRVSVHALDFYSVRASILVLTCNNHFTHVDPGNRGQLCVSVHALDFYSVRAKPRQTIRRRKMARPDSNGRRSFD